MNRRQFLVSAALAPALPAMSGTAPLMLSEGIEDALCQKMFYPGRVFFTQRPGDILYFTYSEEQDAVNGDRPAMSDPETATGGAALALSPSAARGALA